MKTDQALATARQILKLGICECGCTKDEHLNIGANTTCRTDLCLCMAFRPVRFKVERMK